MAECQLEARVIQLKSVDLEKKNHALLLTYLLWYMYK